MNDRVRYDTDGLSALLSNYTEPDFMAGFRIPNTTNPLMPDYSPQVQPLSLGGPNNPIMFPGMANTGPLPLAPPGGAGMPFLSTKDQQGWGSMALGGAQALGGMYMGMKQYGIAKDTLNESKKQFSMNFDAQRRATNAALEDRQRRRVAENPNHAVAVDEYMRKNGIQ